MEDHANNDDEFRYSDEEDYVDDNDDDHQILKSKGPTAEKEDLCRVMEKLSLRVGHARALLIFHRWDVEKLFAVYVEKGKSFLFSEAGVSVDQHLDSDSSLPSSITCEVCTENVPCDEATRMDCGHWFCNACWTGHFLFKIYEGQSKRIRCMEHKCYSICDEAVVRTLLGRKHPDMAENYERFLLESYIEDNNRAKWCPSTPHCGNAIRVKDDKLREVECSCGLQFCFSCLSEAHSPCSCLMWELWAKESPEELATTWIAEHTKLCPKCQIPVEKNGGCNWILCICGQQFCWWCRAAIGREHDMLRIVGHSCDGYKNLGKSDEPKRDRYRYMQYYNRYKAHRDSFKLESKLKQTIQGKIAILEEKDSEIRDYSWVNNGLSRLFRSRRVLSYSYAFAFYMFGDELSKEEMSEAEKEKKRNLFEDPQQQIEEKVEKLSKILDKHFETFSDKNVELIRARIINLSTTIDKLCKKMYECIQNDLLGSLPLGIHSIAPYKSEGIEKASELSVCWSNKPNDTV